MVQLGAHPIVWDVPNEQHSPTEADRIVREHVRWHIADGGLVPIEPTLHGRMTRATTR